MFDNLRGVVCFAASGSRLYSFIDKVREQKIGCRNQIKIGDVLYAKCYKGDFEKIKALADEFSVEIKKVENKGAIFTILRYRRRIGIILGAAVAFGIILYFSNTITQLEINGCQNVDKSAVESVLRYYGIEKGAFIPNLDFDSCERRLLLAIDELSWVGIRSDAGRVVVDVHEGIETPLMLNENIPCNIVASFDAQIVNIGVLEGVGVVQSGYTVKKGDILISGVQEGIKGTTTVKHAQGYVEGIYNISVEFTQNKSELVRIETDEYIQKNTLQLLSIDIPLSFSDVEFDEYNLHMQSSGIYLFGKELPVSIVKNKYTKCEYDLRIYDDTQSQELLYQQKARYEENFLQNTQVLSEKVTIEHSAEQSVLKVDYTLMGEIGRKNEILIKNLN